MRLALPLTTCLSEEYAALLNRLQHYHLEANVLVIEQQRAEQNTLEYINISMSMTQSTDAPWG